MPGITWAPDNTFGFSDYSYVFMLSWTVMLSFVVSPTVAAASKYYTSVELAVFFVYQLPGRLPEYMSRADTVSVNLTDNLSVIAIGQYAANRWTLGATGLAVTAWAMVTGMHGDVKQSFHLGD